MERILNFKGNWRNYQKRILDSLTVHLADKKIHIVAAPGAGKTILGIEVLARLNRPALILAPTLTIRAQWISRIKESFLKDNEDNILSTDIRHPSFITVITYQSLLAAFCGKEDSEQEQQEFLQEEEENKKEFTLPRLNKEKAEEIISILKNAKIQVLCFDEAHHLRNEWWKALNYLRDNLNAEHTVSLTATPPYDADVSQWQRYNELCGDIDEVISIPELVQNGDLCPHQDFVYFSLLRKHESDELEKAILRNAQFISTLKDNLPLIQAVQNCLAKESEETVLETPFVYMSLAAFLKYAKAEIPKEFLQLFDFKYRDIPAFTYEYQKQFLSFILFKSTAQFNFGGNDTEQKNALLNRAKNAGIIFNKTICLNESPKIKKQIANSLGKLDSIKDIVELEYNNLKNDLRMVILADYIKYDITDCSALGVIPIWQSLKENKDISLCVLTGSIILLPAKLKEEFTARIEKAGLKEYVSLSPFERDNFYLKVNVSGGKNAAIVRLITNMFNDGHITVITGTQALLGEGWDAPAVNSLILSSTVSSYMLSNQMRGRAIRKDKNNPDKVANIWHLASIKILNSWEELKQKIPVNNEEAEPNIQLFDYIQLCQRFKGYEAPSVYQNPVSIENGIERLFPQNFNAKIQTFLPKPTEADFTALNKDTIKYAADRNLTKNLWQQGLIKPYNAPQQSLRQGVSTRIRKENFYYRAGYFYILSCWLFLLILPAVLFAQQGAFRLSVLLLAAFCAVMVKPTLRHLRCGSPEKIIRQIGIVILETLSAAGQIKTSLQRINIECITNRMDGSIFFSAANLSPEENNLLIKSLAQVLDPIENPRYIFVRKGILGVFKTTDYHAVPAVIAQKKEYTDIFKILWEKYIGPCEVIYTRSKEGRQFLLNARKKAFSSLTAAPKSKKMSRYQ